MSAQSHAHFTRLLELLHQEKEEDLQQFLRLVRERPLADRVAQGFAWHPLKVLQTGFSLGEKAFVIVERSTRLNEPHQLRAGQTVHLFTTQEHVKHPEKQGVVNYVERNRMKIILNSKDVPDWLDLGQIGVEMLFDDRSFTEMERALNKVMNAKGDRLAELREVLGGGVKSRKPLAGGPTPDPSGEESSPSDMQAQTDNGDKTSEENSRLLQSTPLRGGGGVGGGASEEPENSAILSSLNPSQRGAVRAILDSRDVAVVHGPPGTGKTTTLVAAIQLLCERENTVLVAAPSNTAADLLTERLAAKGLSVVRIGNVSRVDEQVMGHTLEAILAEHPESRNIKKVKIQAAEYRRQARRFKRSFGHEDRREREHLKHQARELEAWANTLEDRLVDEVLTSAQAIICTLVGAAHPVLEKFKFRTCVIDEAAQALEPAAWIPILKCSRVVLAGDPFQLPPTVKSLEAARNGLSKTLIERCLDILPDAVHLLTVQYRMHRAIMHFSNEYFYGGALQAHETVGERRLLSLDPGGETLTVFDPVVFIDTVGTGFEEKITEASKSGHTRALSRYNPDEALLVREHILQLLEKFPAGVRPSIGILSPYREQVNCLEEMIREDAALAPLLLPGGGLTINTIDGFQGQERDVIYISLVRSNAKHDIGFLSDYRRMNVAMTRARMLLVVLGDSATIGQNKFYEAFLDYVEQYGRYQTAWEYLR